MAEWIPRCLLLYCSNCKIFTKFDLAKQIRDKIFPKGFPNFVKDPFGNKFSLLLNCVATTSDCTSRVRRGTW